MEELKSNRDYGIDLLRIVCMIMIPIHHIIVHGGMQHAYPHMSTGYIIVNLVNAMAYFGVNTFAVISGYNMYGRRTKLSNLLNLWIEVLFYSFFIALIFRLINPAYVSDIDFWTSLIPNIYTGDNGFSHYWFFTAYVVMFLLGAGIKSGLEHTDARTDKALAIIVFISFSLLPTVTFQHSAWGLGGGYSGLWLTVVFFYGCLIKKYSLDSKTHRLVWFGIYIICAIISWGIKIGVEYAVGGFYNFDMPIQYITPLYLIGSMALFMSFVKLKLHHVTERVIAFITPAIFGVYLIHDNDFVRAYLVKGTVGNGNFAFLSHYPYPLMVLGMIGCAIGILIVCVCIDHLRMMLFKAMSVNKVTRRIDG